MQLFTKQLLFSLIFTLAFVSATYGVDGCSSAAFKVATSINLENLPIALAVADFNGDGHLDLAVSPNDISGEVMVLFGRGGTERFGPPTSFPIGGEPRRLAAGDFNGDGKPDLVVSLDGFGQTSGRLSIVLNDGTGKFGAPNIITLQGDPSRPVVADLNNDGKLDIVTALFTGTTDGKVAILLGNGAGGFAQAANSPISTFSVNPDVLGIGDFNEDGKRDLAMPGSSGGLSILLGDGAGGFTPGVNTATAGGWLSLTVGDFNNDAHLDVLMDDRMLLGTGTGSFAAPIVVPIPANSRGALAADVNHDGHLDVVAAAQSGITIMLGNGTGNLVRTKSYISGITIFGSASSFAVPGDFNEDGKLDLAAVQSRGINILDGDGTGAFNDALSYHTSIGGPNHLVSADFNNDGKPDIAFNSANQGAQGPAGSGVEVALGDGTGGFTRKSVSSFGTSLTWFIATADFNSDGKLDLAVTQPANGRISILLNDGAGGFPAEGFNAPNIFAGFGPTGLGPTTLKSGDFNNDTKADLIAILPQSNSFVVLLGNGSGGFSIISGLGLQGNAGFSDDVAIGDFNADGKSDLAVVRSSESVVYVLQGDGTGQFSPYATLQTTETPFAVLAKDLSGDGKPDIAVTTSSQFDFLKPPTVTVFINNGAQGFNSGTSYPVDNAAGIATGDFNNDNQPDLVMSSSFSLAINPIGISVLTNNGNGTFNAPVNFTGGPAPGFMAVSDFNNDGKDDVVVTQLGGQSIGLLLNNFNSSQQCLSIDDVTVTENDIGTVNAIFTVKLSTASAQTVRVNYFSTLANPSFPSFSATKGADFENVPGTLTFLPGETTQTITVPVKGDTIDEFDQPFFVVLTTPINAAISDGRGLGTIVDNDAPPAITISDVSVVEGTQVQSTVNLTLSLNAPSEKGPVVNYALQAGTASANVDYADTSGGVSFFGTMSQTISIPIIQDNIFEPDETFFVNLSNPLDATIADGQGQVTITNDDPQPAIAISASSFRTEGATGTTVNAQFDVTLSNPSFQTITVSFATADLNAIAGSDYAATSGTLTFNPGETSKPILVQVTGDNVDEVDEQYVVNLSSPTNATINAAQGTGVILDDDGPTMSIGNASVTEGHTGFVNAVFTVTLSAPSVQTILVNFLTTGGTATSNIDFQRVVFSTLFIPAGATSATINVRVFGDFQIEPDEQFTVTLQNPANATIANATGTGTIVNDDSNGKLQFSSQTYSATEDAGSVVITVSRVEGATGTVTVTFTTSNGTATAGSDYTATSGTFTFNQGETSKSFSIPIVSDNIFEPEETVNLTLSNPTGGGTLGTVSTATLTIKTPPLFLVLEEGALDPNRVAALDSLLSLRDPFPVIEVLDLLTPGLDRNTRVIVFVTNLQLAPHDPAAVVRVNLVDSNGQSFDVGAEDVRVASVSNFIQITFRLPDNLAPGVCNIKIKAHDQESNTGTMRIKN